MRKNYFVPLLLFLNLMLTQCASSQFLNFISRKGDKIYDGEKEFRFISFNIPNLHYIEDYLPFDSTNPWRLPDEYEIRDALTTIKMLGGKVARIYVLSVRKESDSSEIIRHIEAPSKFNEDAFCALDKVMQIANEIGVRIIIPFVDNWHWWGGPKEYASFREKSRDEFWNDSTLISDFKQTINFLINRKNYFTDVLYKDDKALLGWETGNELSAPIGWTKEIAEYIKSLDTNHLVIEGTFSKSISQESLDDPNIDIVTTHHYGNAKSSIAAIVENQKFAKEKKPYIIGEYGLVPTVDIRAITDTIINNGLTGGMLWSLRFHNREGGFYHHTENSKFASYRFPGFSNGEYYDEKAVLTLIREKAYQIDNRQMPPLPVPESPELLETDDISKISWRGSAGAASYTIERKEEYETDWKIIAENLEDAKYQYRPLFNDESAEISKRYFYRMFAKNESGISAYSNIIGPIDVSFKKLVDEFENFNYIFQKDGKLQLLTYEKLREAKEDRSRLVANDSSYIVYKTPNDIFEFQLDVFLSDSSSKFRVFISQDSENFEEIIPEKKIFSVSKNDYGFFDAARFSGRINEENIRFIKIEFRKGIQLSRIEISYK